MVIGQKTIEAHIIDGMQYFGALLRSFVMNFVFSF